VHVYVYKCCSRTYSIYADLGRLICVNQTQLICCQSDSKLKFIHIEKMNFLGAFVCLSQCVYMRECNTMAQNTICLAHYVLVWNFDSAPSANHPYLVFE